MKYQSAQKVKEKNQHLIGTFYNGLRIDELIIYPLKDQSLRKFLQLYLQEYDSTKSILPFINEDEFNVGVVCDIRRLDRIGWFAPLPIENIADAILDIE